MSSGLTSGKAALQASETRANQAEARAATAEAVVTVQARSQAATSTALAYVNSPEAAVDRGLRLVLAVEREPTEQRIRTLGDAFAPAALVVLRPEVEHLLSGGLHLGGDSGYEITVAATTRPPDQAQVRTRERWTYDERNAADELTVGLSRRQRIVDSVECQQPDNLLAV